MSKRQYAQEFAKEDSNRFKEKRPSIASEILKQDDFDKMKNLILKKSKKNEEHGYLKTAEAWYKRYGSLTMTELENLKTAFIKTADCIEIEASEHNDDDLMEIPLSEKPEDEISLSSMNDLCEEQNVNDNRSMISKTNDNRSVASKISKVVDNKSVVSNMDEKGTVVSKISKVVDNKSVVSNIDDDERSVVSKTSKVVDNRSVISKIVDDRSVISKTSKVVDNKSVVSKVDDNKSVVSKLDDNQSVVSEAVSNFDNKSVASHSHNKETYRSSMVKSLSKVKDLVKETEQNIEDWYNDELKKMQTQNLRDEQYRRKRAMLRVEYWARMDKIRNNANPTVINA